MWKKPLIIFFAKETIDILSSQNSYKKWLNLCHFKTIFKVDLYILNLSFIKKSIIFWFHFPNDTRPNV